jgi:hypothetical protein
VNSARLPKDRPHYGRLAACFVFYVLAALVIGREVLAHVSDAIANDWGDPILTTTILHWNATHLPYTDAWYQLPIFFPTRDAMTFSEHLLGVSVVAAPIEWVTGSPIIAYNVTLVLSFALSAMAMYALAWRLTRSVAASFIAGLAYGFAPFRISQLPHIQMEIVWYAPLALLGLHAYLETAKRRWLALYGIAWMLQAAANGYLLVFLSLLIALWVLWFVVVARRWRAFVEIGATTIIAALPLAPILLRYLRAHDYYGMVRGIEEVKYFSADMAAMLCAPQALTFWGWLRIACRPEGELFPGVALFALFVAATISIFKWGPRAAPSSRSVRIITGVLLAAAAVYGSIAASVAWFGPWTLAIGPLHASSSSVAKPLLVAIVSVVLAFALPPGARLAARRTSVMSFYVLAAIVIWVFALGPRLRVMDKSIGYDGPYALLMYLPGVDGLRVPARLWILAVLCLAAVAALFVAELLKRRGRLFEIVGVPVIAALVLADGWVNQIPTQPLPPSVPNPSALVGRTVLDLPTDLYRAIFAQYRALMGGWRTVTGYSGYDPPYYRIVSDASKKPDALPGVLEAFQGLGELDVVVARDASDPQMVLRQQPGVMLTGENAEFTQFRLPAKPQPAREGGSRVPIQSLSSSCRTADLRFALDRDPLTQWMCGPGLDEQRLTIDLGRVQQAGAVRHEAGDFPRQLIVETSVDGVTWMPAWSGNALAAAITAAMRDPKAIQIWFPFEPRPARYLRLVHPGDEQSYYWSLAELEVWSR